jgi:membrane protease subunit HflC
MKRNPLTFIIGLLLIIIFVLLLFVFQVRQTEVAVVTTFGKPTRPITKPGAYLKWPWPIQKVYKFDQRTQNFEDKLTEDQTRDNNILLTMVYVGWRITDPQVFFPKFPGGSIAEAERHLEGLLRNAKSAVVGKHALSDFVSANPQGTKLNDIEREILAVLDSQLKANNYGLQVDFIGLKKVELPESVTQTVFDRMKSERDVLSNKSQYEGEAEAQKIRSAADRKAADMITEADAKATEIRGQGEAEAAKLLPTFQKNPDLANFLSRLNALEASTKERTILIFDPRTPPFDLFNGSLTEGQNLDQANRK